MLNIDKKKVASLFAITLLTSSLLLASFDVLMNAKAADETLNLHGPPLKPIHMHSNISLEPIHMHYTAGILWPEVYPITEPNCTTDWRKLDLGLDPFDFEWWHLSSWEDNGEPIGELSQNDQIDMYNWDYPEIVEWFHVDRMTLTLELSGPYFEPWFEPGEVRSILEMKQPYCNPYDPYIVYDPWGSLWSQVWPVQQGVANPITDWLEGAGGNMMLDFCDTISFDQGYTWWHVEDIATDLILRWKIMDPIGTYWHELYPEYCEWYEMTSWSSYPDPYCDRISPRDTIDMLRLSDTTTHWYFVDRVTITINVTDMQTMDWMMLELKTAYFEEMYHAFKKPIGTFWHAVYPEDVYCTVFNLTFWDPIDPIYDNCNGVLDPCDYIILENMDSGLDSLYHITDMAYDIILNEYITDPIGSTWNEVYPDGTFAEYTVLDFEDNNSDIWLSPCDNVTLADPTGFPNEYHVENVTLTLNLTILDVVGGTSPFTPQQTVYLEHLQLDWNYTWPQLYHPKIEPWDTDWQVVNPTTAYGLVYTIDEWDDNCNGVIDYCDTVYMWDYVHLNGIIAHVDEIAVDMVVSKGEPPPPPSWYMKPPYPDYARSGMPDFDQRQLGTYWWNQTGVWDHCGPVAVANSLWWLDSKFEPNTTPPPAIIDNYPLVQAYGAWDDHDPLNVPPLVEHLAYLMDTNGRRTGLFHLGTDVFDMQAGITHYLSWSGVNPLGDVDGNGIVDAADGAIVTAAMGTTPGAASWDMRADIFPVTTGYPPVADNIIDAQDMLLVTNNLGRTGQFYEHTQLAPDWGYIVEQVLMCQDVELLLVPWYFDPDLQEWYRYDEGAHYVTVAGLNATEMEIVFSDPIRDNAEAGGAGNVPIPHAHTPPPEPPYITHNNASLVSHDMYHVIVEPCPGGPLAIPDYWGGAIPPPAPYPVFIIQIEAAIVTCPYEVDVHDVAVTDIVTSKTGCLPLPTVGEGFTANITVTVENQGDFIENFNVNVYANATTIGTAPVMLNPSDSTTLTFVWNTTGFLKGNYTISATADIVPGETDTADNTFIDGMILVTTPGDINGDTYVNIKDAVLLGVAFGANSGDPNWNPNADLNDDGYINIKDAVVLGVHFGEHW